MAAKVVRVSEEAYNRMLKVSQAYGLHMTQAANLLILGRVHPDSNGKWHEELPPVRDKARPERGGLKCPQCRGDLELMRNAPGVYMLKCPKCYEAG